MPSTLHAIVNAVAAYLLVVFVCTVEIARLECGASACDLQTAPDPFSPRSYIVYDYLFVPKL